MPGPAPAPASKNRGCLIALAVVAGLALLTCLVGSVVAWRFAQDPEVQKVLTAVGAGAKLAAEGNKAPGTDELRAAGCGEALVIDGRAMTNLLVAFADAGVDAEVEPGMMVMCQGNLSGKPLPSCDEVARVYVRAVAPTRGFTVSVASSDPTKQCNEQYDETGTPWTDDDLPEPAGDEEDPPFPDADDSDDAAESDEEANPEPKK